jgi:hypothetical protein
MHQPREVTSEVATYRADKLENLILYIALKYEPAPHFGRTKLAKILFFSDFEAYLKLGQPITGTTYLKREYGPCPAEFQQVETRLEATRRAHERIVPAGPFRQQRLVALVAPELELFSAAEIAIVDTVIVEYWNETASDVSEYSHRFPGWKLAALGEEIPYFSALIPEKPLPLSAEELQRAKESLTRLFPR